MKNYSGTFVTVGNAKQPFNRLFALIENVLELLPKPIIAQTGSAIVEIQGVITYEILQGQHFSQLIKDSSVVIMHAGAGSLIHALNNLQKPIVIPRRLKYGEHIDDHQIQLAREFYKQDKIFLIENVNDIQLALDILMASKDKKNFHDNGLFKQKLIALLENIKLNKHN